MERPPRNPVARLALALTVAGLLALPVITPAAAAEGEPSAIATATNALPPGLQLKPLGDGVFGLGMVRLDKKARTVSFPAIVNQRDGPVEYLVVRNNGKTHESILTTAVEPRDIHLAMLLLGAKPADTNLFPAPPAPPPGDPVRIEVTWEHKGHTNRLAAEDLVIERESRRQLAKGPWTYNGSNISEGGFTAQRDGSIISTRVDPDALINNPRTGRENEDLYTTNAKLLPVDDRLLTLTIFLSPAAGRPAPAATPDRGAKPE